MKIMQMLRKWLRPVGPTFTIRVLPDDDANRDISQIDIPDSVKNYHDSASTRGVIVDISKYAWKSWYDGKPWASIGDIVRVWSYSGNNDVIDGVMYRVCQDKDIWCIEETREESEIKKDGR